MWMWTLSCRPKCPRQCPKVDRIILLSTLQTQNHSCKHCVVNMSTLKHTPASRNENWAGTRPPARHMLGRTKFFHRRRSSIAEPKTEHIRDGTDGTDLGRLSGTHISSNVYRAWDGGTPDLSPSDPPPTIHESSNPPTQIVFGGGGTSSGRLQYAKFAMLPLVGRWEHGMPIPRTRSGWR